MLLSRLQARLDALLRTCHSLEEKREAEMHRSRPDDMMLQRLERRRRLVRDEIEAIERQIRIQTPSDSRDPQVA